MKKIIVSLVVLIVVFLVGCGGNSKKEKTDPLGFQVDFSDSFRNDTTGNWRKALIAEDKEIQDYALDYYKNYFKSDNEIHIIYNFTLNTVNRLALSGDALDISVTDYIKGEEHDASLACSGNLLEQFQINLKTGEITE